MLSGNLVEINNDNSNNNGCKMTLKMTTQNQINKRINQRLELALSRFVGVKNALLFSSCRNALYTLIKSLELKETDEVLVQSFICDSLPMAIEKAGAKPILIEVNEETFNLDSRIVEEAINENTRAVLFVHTYGNPSGIEEISGLCKKHNLILIEDIAHALGASCNGKAAGSFGDYTIYSLTKQMVNFGGGALLTNRNLRGIIELRDEEKNKPVRLNYPKRFMASLYETRAFFLSKLLIDFVRKRADLKLANLLSSHFYCTKIEAYFALRQLTNLPNTILLKRKNYDYLKKYVNTQRIEGDSSFNYLSLVFPDKKTRDLALKKHFLFLPPWDGSTISERLIFIPNNPQFTRKELNSIVNVYNKVYKMGV